jgi:hypothetical protein
MEELDTPLEAVLQDAAGRTYEPRVRGRIRQSDGLWEGWLEFVSSDGGPVLRTPRETEQHSREDLLYWASGLGDAYLEGALQRALDHAGDEPPAVAAPAPRPAPARPHPILDPFHVYGQGEDVLRKELLALDSARLRDIIEADGLVPDEAVELEAMSRASLADLIVAAVRKRTE